MYTMFISENHKNSDAEFIVGPFYNCGYRASEIVLFLLYTLRCKALSSSLHPLLI